MNLFLEPGFKTKVHQAATNDLMRYIETGRLDLFSEFRESFAWSQAKKSKFIESLLLGLPVSSIWVEETKYGSLLIIDGIQRIEAIRAFINNEFNLKRITVLNDLNGCYYSDLEFRIQNALVDSVITINTIYHDVNPRLKCEFYRRYHEGDRNKNVSQIARNYAFSRASEKLRSLAENYSRIVTVSQIRGRFGKERYKSNARIEEFYLGLILINTLLEGIIYGVNNKYSYSIENVDLPIELLHDDSIETALDKTMMLVEHNDFDVEHTLVGRSLSLLCEIKGVKQIDLTYSSKIKAYSLSNNMLSIDEALSLVTLDSIGIPINVNDFKPFRFFQPLATLDKLIRYISNYHA